LKPGVTKAFNTWLSRL